MKTPVKEWMAPSVIVVGPEATVGEVREQMAAHDIGAVPVVDAGGALQGIVTSSDLLASFPATLPVSRIMTTRVHSLPTTAEVGQAAGLMRRARCHHIVVMEEGRVAGILSSFDLLRLLDEGSPTASGAERH